MTRGRFVPKMKLRFSISIEKGRMTRTTETPTPKSPQECRCDCGQLLAKGTDDGVEIKCKRCRRVVLFPWSRLIRE